MKLANKKIFTIALAATTLHLLLTSAIGYYIAVQRGKELGKIVSEGLSEIMEARRNLSAPKAKEAANTISQDMERKREELTKKWEIPMTLISLPVRHFMSPLLVDLQLERAKKVLSKEISTERFYTEQRLMIVAVILVNSCAFGLLIFAIIIIFNLKQSHNKQRDPTGKKPRRKSRTGRK
jgi:hypothetical protein